MPKPNIHIPATARKPTRTIVHGAWYLGRDLVKFARFVEAHVLVPGIVGIVIGTLLMLIADPVFSFPFHALTIMILMTFITIVLHTLSVKYTPEPGETDR